MEENSYLSALIGEAFKIYKDFSESYQNYPPIYESHDSLKRIQALLAEYPDLIKFRKIVLADPYLNVGLLAAKALDPIPRVKNYTRRLHKIWYFISPLNIPSFSARQALAYYFYKHHRYSDFRISSHFCGINFYKPVFIKILPKIIRVYQWKLEEDEQGHYYAENKRAKPDCLGISTQKKDRKGNVLIREKYIFETSSQIALLCSYAAPVLDWWSLGRNNPVQTTDGCVQYFNNNDKLSFKKVR